jgi:hypothetical protein
MNKFSLIPSNDVLNMIKILDINIQHSCNHSGFNGVVQNMVENNAYLLRSSVVSSKEQNIRHKKKRSHTASLSKKSLKS